MRTSRRKTPPALRLRAARERRLARLFKHEALEQLYNFPTCFRHEMLQIELRFRKFYKGPYEHRDPA